MKLASLRYPAMYREKRFHKIAYRPTGRAYEALACVFAERRKKPWMDLLKSRKRASTSRQKC